MSEDTSQALNSMVDTHCSRFGNKRISKETSDVIFSSSFLNGIVKDETMRRSRKELKNVFSPRNFLKGMGVTSGSINLSAIEVIRNHVEGARKG